MILLESFRIKKDDARIILDFIKGKDHIEVHAHRKPDVDALSSMMMISLFLSERKKNHVLVIDRDDDLNLKIEGTLFSFKAANNLDKKQRYAAIILDSGTSRSTLNTQEISTQEISPKSILIIDHHESRDLESVITPLDTLFEMFTIKHRCISTGFLLYQIFHYIKMFQDSPMKQNIIRYLAAASVEGDTVEGKLSQDDYKQAMQLLITSESDKKKVKEIYQKLKDVLKSKIETGFKKQNQDSILAIAHSDSDPGYVANTLFEKANGKKDVIVVKKDGGIIRFSIRSSDPLKDESRNLITGSINGLGRVIGMGFSNCQVVGGRIETIIPEKELLYKIKDILDGAKKI